MYQCHKNLLQTSETVTLDLTIDSGRPVQYTISWSVNDTDFVFDENGKLYICFLKKFQNITLDTNAKPQQFTYSYTDPGEYVVNLTAYNLHSETYGYVKYTHNLSRFEQKL